MNTEDLALKIRQHAVIMTHLGKSSHVGSALSMADIVAVLYGEVLNVKPKEPTWPERDRFILSKGHAGAGIYAALAETGFMPIEKLKTHYQDGSDLSGHVSHKGIPGVELSTGSLGHGLNVGCGMALAAKKQGKNHKVYVLLSDGECDEGSNWEAILFSSHHKLDNLVAVVDYNKIQSLDKVADTIGLEPFSDKWRAFGWEVVEADGHNHSDLKRAFATQHKGKPLVVLAHTTKGKGVSFMEDTVLWHYRTAQGEEFDNAMKELGASFNSDSGGKA